MNGTKAVLTFAAIAIGVCTAESAKAATTIYSNLTAWEAAVGASTETTNFGVPDLTTVTSYALNGGPTVSLGTSTEVTSIGSTSNNWMTWCCGYTGQVLVTAPDLAGGTSTATGTFSHPVRDFGIFAEPAFFGLHDITFTLSDGTTLAQSVEGNGGIFSASPASPATASARLLSVAADLPLAMPLSALLLQPLFLPHCRFSWAA